LEDTVKLVAACGRINQDVPSVGMMATLQASAEQVSKALEPYGGKIGIASINGPCSTVISGNKKRVTKLLEKFESEGVKTQPWAASNAFHSRFIEPMLDGFTRVASEVKFHPPTLQLISTLTGKLMPMDEAPDANYWRRHLREPVQFYAAMQTLHELGCETFLEIGLHSTQWIWRLVSLVA
jgi:acyl transferase domain-containing protein